MRPLHTLWTTDNITKGAEELVDFLTTSDITPTERVGPVTATIQVALVREVVRDETGQVTQPGQLQIRYLLPSQRLGNIQIETTFDYTGEPVNVPIYRSREDGSQLDTDGHGIPYSIVVVQHADGSNNTLYDFAIPGYPSIPLQPGDTIVVPTAELPISAPVDRMNYFEKLITAIELAQYEDASPEVGELIEAIQANPALFLAIVAIFCYLQPTPIGILFDLICALGFGTQTATSLFQFLNLVGQAVDVEELRGAGRVFNQFGNNLINTLLSGAAGVSGLPSLIKYFDFVRAIPQATNVSLLTQSFQLIRQLLGRIRGGSSPLQAALEELKVQNTTVSQFMQRFGSNERFVEVLDQIEATNDTAKFARIPEIAEQLAKPEYAHVANALDQFPDAIGAILKFGPEALQILVDRAAQMGDLLPLWTKRLSMISPQEGAEILEGVQYCLQKRQQLGLNILNPQGQLTNNVGFGQFEIDLPNGQKISEVRDNLIAVTGGNTSPNGTIPRPLVRYLTGTTPPPRDNDSEAKILEEIASRIIHSGVQPDSNGKYSSVEGTISIFTERKPCSECTDLITDDWYNLFPNVRIEKVVHGPRYLAPGRPSDLDNLENFSNVLQ